jgi:hypothetical protein
LRSGLRGERDGSRPGESAGELGEDREVGVKLDALKPTDAERDKRPFVLEASELSLDGGAARVELAPAQRLSRDQRVQAVDLDPVEKSPSRATGGRRLLASRVDAV